MIIRRAARSRSGHSRGGRAAVPGNRPRRRRHPAPCRGVPRSAARPGTPDRLCCAARDRARPVCGRDERLRQGAAPRCRAAVLPGRGRARGCAGWPATRRRSRRTGARALAFFIMLFIPVSVLAIAEEITGHSRSLAATPIALPIAAYFFGRHAMKDATAQATGRGPRRPSRLGATRRAQRNGWLAPDRQPLLMVTEECMGGEPPHPWCVDDRCQCPCGHPLRNPQPAQLALPGRAPL